MIKPEAVETAERTKKSAKKVNQPDNTSQVEVFWVVTPCSVVVGYQPFGGLCWLHLQDDVAGDGKNRHIYSLRV
jgi:hypothetical protein